MLHIQYLHCITSLNIPQPNFLYSIPKNREEIKRRHSSTLLYMGRTGGQVGEQQVSGIFENDLLFEEIRGNLKQQS